MSPEERARASEEICNRVISSGIFFSSHSIGCYLPTIDEVDTRSIIERGWRANKRIFVPVLRKGRQMSFREISPDTPLQMNAYGVWEPLTGEVMSPGRLDIAIAPTVAYDDDNNRIGMGGGYFDRCFSYLRHRKNWLRPKLIGVAFQCQKVEKISPNAWDIRLYRVFSDE